MKADSPPTAQNLQRHTGAIPGMTIMQIGVETSRAVENKRIFIVSDDEIARAALQFMLHDEYEAHDLPDLGQICCFSAWKSSTRAGPACSRKSARKCRARGLC